MRQAIQHISPVYRFLLFFALAALAWFFLYHYLLKPYTNIDMGVVNATLAVSKKTLTFMGHTAFVEGRLIRIAGTSGLWVGDNCNAIALFALFSGFILCFPGNVRSKIWYIPTGILLIFLLNCLRMVILAISDVYSREWTKFNHNYTFTIVMYGFIFLLWIYWVNRYSFARKTAKIENHGH